MWGERTSSSLFSLMASVCRSATLLLACLSFSPLITSTSSSTLLTSSLRPRPLSLRACSSPGRPPARMFSSLISVAAEGKVHDDSPQTLGGGGGGGGQL